MMSMLEKYKTKVIPELVKDLKLDNVMQVPKVNKVVVNAGVGGFREAREALEAFTAELSVLTGQKPTACKARLSEAGFKIRKGDTVGYAVTLRGQIMWSFLEKLVTVVLPRTRGFWGLDPKSFDGSGNYSLGIREHTVFPEVNPNAVNGIRSLQISVNTSTRSDKEALHLLKSLGFPFKKD